MAGESVNNAVDPHYSQFVVNSFTHLLTSICNPPVHVGVIRGRSEWQRLSHRTGTLSAEQGRLLLAFPRSRAANKCPFQCVAYFCAFSFGVILLLKMAPKHSVEVLSSVPWHLVETIPVSGKLPSGMSCSAVDCEFRVNQQHILNKVLDGTHIKQSYVDQL